ncbi:hypothetical protein CEXT_430751 [Caerostris extrusa]|uniref:Uncharacterized protein n=1 Tax=Caerostris extrusa TaxID=172846 RepID=A0AAV4SCW0_CAEEX|nr:hypothetical protein CEXT_430751 [Caerostris extrusa]
MNGDARAELELYQKGLSDSGACPIVNCARHSVAEVTLKPKAGLKGLPVTYETAEIAEGLKELGFEIDKVIQLNNQKAHACLATHLYEI